jgi:hypothetical protein
MATNEVKHNDKINSFTCKNLKFYCTWSKVINKTNILSAKRIETKVLNNIMRGQIGTLAISMQMMK